MAPVESDRGISDGVRALGRCAGRCAALLLCRPVLEGAQTQQRPRLRAATPAYCFGVLLQALTRRPKRFFEGCVPFCPSETAAAVHQFPPHGCQPPHRDAALPPLLDPGVNGETGEGSGHRHRRRGASLARCASCCCWCLHNAVSSTSFIFAAFISKQTGAEGTPAATALLLLLQALAARFQAYRGNHWQWGGQPGNYALMVKQGFCVNEAIRRGRAEGLEWIFHLDVDELFLPELPKARRRAGVAGPCSRLRVLGSQLRAASCPASSSCAEFAAHSG